MELEQRVFVLEQDIKQIYDRLGNVEDKASGAWKTISEINVEVSDLRSEVQDLRKEVGQLKQDTKELKTMQIEMTKAIKVLSKIIGVLCMVVIAYFIYSIKSGSEIPEKIVETIVPFFAT